MTAFLPRSRPAWACWSLLLFALSCGLTGRAESVAQAVPLFNGQDLAGWECITPEKTAIASVCHLSPGGVLVVDGKPVGYLQTTADSSNYRLHFEWRWSAVPGNSGVLVHIATGPLDRNLWPRCFQIQTKVARVGDLLPMAGAAFAETLSTKPGAKTPQLDHAAAGGEKPAGQWNTCDIICRGDTIEVVINGLRQNRVTKCTPASGRIGFQLEGAPYELRRVELTSLR